MESTTDTVPLLADFHEAQNEGNGERASAGERASTSGRDVAVAQEGHDFGQMTPPGFVLSDEEVDSMRESIRALQFEAPSADEISGATAASVSGATARPATDEDVLDSAVRSHRPHAMSVIREEVVSFGRNNSRRPLSADAATRPKRQGNGLLDEAGTEIKGWIWKDSGGAEVMSLDNHADGESASERSVRPNPPRSISENGGLTGGLETRASGLEIQERREGRKNAGAGRVSFVTNVRSPKSSISGALGEWGVGVPAWYADTPGVAQVLSMNPSTTEFREGWSRLRQVYSKRHTASTRSDFQKDTELLSKRLNSITFHVIHAQKNPYLRYWDGLIMLLISLTTVIQPYEVAFTLHPIFGYLNFVMDFIFLMDTMLQFNIAYYDNVMARTVMVHRAIARHYVSTSFAVDLLASLPYQVILWGLGYHRFDKSDPSFIVDSSRLWSCLGLLRLLRMLRAQRLMGRMERIFSIDHGMLSILTFVMQTFLLSHFSACLWGLAPVIQGVVYGHENASENDMSYIVSQGQYSYCLYFAVKTLTSVGYGDIYPLTTFERWLSMCFMLCGAYFFGYVIGSITNTVSVRNHAQNLFYETMDKLQAFVEEHQVNQDLRSRLRSYFIYRYKSDAGGGVSWNEIFDLMSPSLKQEVAKNTCARWIANVSFFKGCEEDFIVRLSLSLHPETFTPREKIITLGEESNRMYVVRQGVVASEGRIFISGGVIGLDMLTNLYIMSAAIRNYEGIALTFSNVMRCDRKHVLEILDRFPNSSATLRHTIIRHVFQTEIRSYSRAVVRMITGKRSVHARLMGDPSGREEHYFNKLLELSPESDLAALQETLQAARAPPPEDMPRQKTRRRTSHLLHRANDVERERGPALAFEGHAYEMEELPALLMAQIREMKEQIMQLHAESKSGIKLAGGGVVEGSVPPSQAMPPRMLNRQLTNMPALPFRPYAHDG